MGADSKSQLAAKSHDPHRTHSQSEPDRHLEKTRNPAPNHARHAQITSRNPPVNRSPAPKNSTSTSAGTQRQAAAVSGAPRPSMPGHWTGAPGRARDGGRTRTYTQGGAGGGSVVPRTRRPWRVSSRGGIRGLATARSELGLELGGGRWRRWWEGGETRWWWWWCKWAMKGRMDLK